jgi:hypothetical protein
VAASPAADLSHLGIAAGCRSQRPPPRRQHPGKVLGVKRKNKHFQVKMLHEGRVRYVSIKAE